MRPRGTSPNNRRFFDPVYYRIFHLIRCIRSPFASCNDGTHKSHSCGRLQVTGIILRGIFLLRKKEIDWFYEGGAAAIYPDVWEPFRDLIPEEERKCLLRLPQETDTDNLETQKHGARATPRVVDGRGAKEDGVLDGGVDHGVAQAELACGWPSLSGAVLEAHRGTSVDLTKRSSLAERGRRRWQRLVTRHGYGGLECTGSRSSGGRNVTMSMGMDMMEANQYGPHNGDPLELPPCPFVLLSLRTLRCWCPKPPHRSAKNSRTNVGQYLLGGWCMKSHETGGVKVMFRCQSAGKADSLRRYAPLWVSH
ncbi:hypothetical protein HAX54_017775 [Datura stramonium]|uniref:Uncharacterized protein n=1 Tax=Datura stramonium TaxID=4076 RepID=A0ABS8UL71_DATST|nr:hypothetical protein [Datura stramonium]